MHLYIDNNDGLGGVDYTGALLADLPLTVVRKKGEWATCRGGVDVAGAGLPLPLTRARVTVTDDAGAVLFAGFFKANAAAVKAGAAAGLLHDAVVVEAVEQGWLTAAAAPGVLQPAGAAVRAVAVSDVVVEETLAPAAALHDVATDVTLTGAKEPAAYVTELFRGDRTTTSFLLTHAPFKAAETGALIGEAFDEAALNAAVWTKTDPGGYMGLGAGGLHLGGGSGVDGAVVLAYAEPVEMGGTLVASASGVSLNSGSDGVLLGFYGGAVLHGNCVAGVRVMGSAGAYALCAVVNGADQPATYALTAGHTYTVRVRVHCVEMQRVLGTYQALVDGVVQAFGGGTVAAGLQVVVEVLDEGLASSTLPTVLYSGAMATSSAQCVFAPVNSTALVGSVATVGLSQGGSAWVVSTATDGTVTTRREGSSGTGADFTLSSTGNVTFAAGRVPQPGELVTVTYRREQRAVARLKDATAALEATEWALPGLPQWSGHVLKPAARSSADCAAAAAALLALADGAATAARGRVTWTRGAATTADVQVGDTLSVATAEGTRLLPVVGVTLTDGNCVPERVVYRAEFEQSRAVGLSFTVGEPVASDLPLPVGVTVAATGLPDSLAGLQVTSATTTALQVDAGEDAPSGGGFEVRRSAANFGSASTADLVLTSPVRSFSISRAAFAERFFVRMYDGSTPPRYGAVSSVVMTHLPTS